jgi:hypothetical protein
MTWDHLYKEVPATNRFLNVPQTIALTCHLWQDTAMEFTELLHILQEDPLFESELLMAGDVDPANVQRQLSRWAAQGRIYQLRRGLYVLAPPYQSRPPHPFRVANRMAAASYVSCQSALAFYDLIPEYTPATVSVTPGRPGKWDTPLGLFIFRHLRPGLFQGYRLTDLGGGEQAFIASPEKAILDLVHLTPQGDSPAYLSELRLQNVDRIDRRRLREEALDFGRPKMQRAVEAVEAIYELPGED